MGYLEGCATKYITRHRSKGGIEDLRKARHYLEKLSEEAGILKDYRVALDYEFMSDESLLFSEINYLSNLEASVLRSIVIWETKQDVDEAISRLDKLMARYEEPSVPGTPDDGGHHAER